MYARQEFFTQDINPTRISSFDLAQGNTNGAGIVWVTLTALNTQKSYGRVWCFSCGFKILSKVIYLLDVPKAILDQGDANAAKLNVIIGTTLGFLTVDVVGNPGETVHWTCETTLSVRYVS